MISKEERAELRLELSDARLGFPLPWRLGEDADIVDDDGDAVADCMVDNSFTGSSAERYIVAAANAAPTLLDALDALDAADERIAGLEKEAKHWRESALAWAHWAASVTGEADQEIPDLTKFVAELKARIAELEAAAQWRPMATAPRDGTEILVWCLGQHYELVAWEEHSCHQWIGDASRYDEDQVCAWLPIPALPEGARAYGVMTAECKVDELEAEVARLRAEVADLKAAPRRARLPLSSGVKMTLPAWRPLKDAPQNLPAYVETNSGVHVATWDDEWGYWLGEELRILSEDTLSLPIADALELDRAVQGEIARAFGALLSRLLASSQQEHLATFAPPKQVWVKKRLLREANESRQRGLRAFASILHTSMGGRIPDEVP